jgi:hypothetical protein
LYFLLEFGEVSEWLIEPVSKTGVPFGHRGFESRPLRYERGEYGKGAAQLLVPVCHFLRCVHSFFRGFFVLVTLDSAAVAGEIYIRLIGGR